MLSLHSTAKKSCLVGLVCLGLGCLLGFGALALGAIDTYLRIGAIVCVFVFILCSSILWLEGLVVTFQRWNQRSVGINLGRLVFLLVGHFVAAYVLHALLRRQKSNQVNNPSQE